MEIIYVENPRKIRQNKEAIEKKVEIRITPKGRQLELEGEPFEEYQSRIIIEAIDFGFSLKEALRLTEESIVFRKIPIKQFTKRKDLEEVRGRVIGTEGKTKRTVEEVSGCAVVLHNNMVGIIGPAEGIEEATTAVTNLIRGSKQANVYRFLERMNVAKKDKTDLGLKTSKKTKEKEPEYEESEEDFEEEPED
jgi:ribosomal RNA assembly protein